MRQIVKVKEINKVLVVGKHQIRCIGFNDKICLYVGLFLSELQELYDHKEYIEEQGVGCLVSVFKDEFMHEPVYQCKKSNRQQYHDHY